MHKTDLAHLVAESLGTDLAGGSRALDAVLTCISGGLARGEKITLPGFGVFEVRPRAARSGRNPQTGEPLEIPAGAAPAFKPSAALKDAVSPR